jgi:hypothetical protein
MQHNTQTKLNAANEALRQQTDRSDRLFAETKRLSNLVAQVAMTPATTNSPSIEMLKLRGEVGRLRRENENVAASKTNGPSPLSGMTANPEMYKLIRDQQKAGLSVIYKGFTNSINLAPEQSEKLVDLLADNVMENIDRITEVLRDGKTGEEMNQVFTAQEGTLLEKVQSILSPEDFAKYKDYTQNIASHLTGEQFKGMMTGENAEKDEKAKQIFQLMQEETKTVLTSAGLPSDYQTVPTLNFRNIASEAEADKNLKLLDDIYGRVATRVGSFLTPEEVEKFGEFRSKAINANRMALSINRKMMGPGSK